MKKKALITGVTGQDGSYLAESYGCKYIEFGLKSWLTLCPRVALYDSNFENCGGISIAILHAPAILKIAWFYVRLRQMNVCYINRITFMIKAKFGSNRLKVTYSSKDLR